MRSILWILLCLTILSANVQGENILGVFTSPGKSHLIIFMSTIQTMIERGHNVTVLTTIPIPNMKANDSKTFRHIHLSSLDLQPSEMSKQISALVQETNFNNFVKTMQVMANLQRNALRTEKFKQFLQENNTFDLMLLGYFGNDYLLGIGAHFECPVALITLGGPAMGPIGKFIGNPDEISYVPSPVLGIQQPMNFLNRTKNFIINIVQTIAQHYLDYLMNGFYEEHFPKDKYPPLSSLQQNVSIVLSNHHFSEGPIRPDVPAVVEIGGIQINDKISKLPDHLSKFLDNAKNGAIFFSLGSTAKSSDLSPETIKLFFNVLSKLPQKILWKWDDDEKTPGKSDNILFDKWLPQNDVLAHKHIQLFITHGGKGSVVESQYHGVPMVVIPLFGDQTFNAKEIEEKMYGISINHKTVTGEEFEKVVNEVLRNKKYLTNVKLFSELYQDRPITAKENAVFWMEYVIRHKGAHHLQSPAVHMNFVQLHNLDVIVVVVLLLLLLKLVIWKVFSCSWSYCKPKEKSKIQ
ncbi:hypothetical protein ACFFRR_000588 [Megaselia abdita]